MRNFGIQKEKHPSGANILTLNGHLDANTYEELEKTFEELFEKQNYRVIVDLNALEYISSAGAGVFIGAIGTIQENEGKLILVKPSQNVKEVFDLLGLSQIFEFSESKEEALKLFQ